MKKPTVFIGSSVEHKHLAEVVQSLLDYDVTPVVWTQDTFEPSHFPLESLENSLDLVDFAILICAPEDITTMRGQQHHTVRDNVLFELGLFIGRLSRQRTFLIAPRSQSVHLPSDLSGLSPETYDPALLSTNPEAALGPACGKIKRAIRKLGNVSRPDPAEAPDYQKSHEIPQADEHKFNEVDEPASDWTSTDYRWRYFFALTRDDEPKAQRIADGFLESVASSPESIAEWEAWQQYAAQLAGKGGDLDVIRNKSTLFPQSARLKKLLAQSLLHYGDKESALSLLFEALGQASEMQLAAKIVDQALDIDEPSPHKARTLLDALNRIPRSTSADETSYLDAISKIAKSGGFEEVSKAILEVLLSVQPQDTQTRASLAYSYSEAGEQELSMLHYELVPAQERSGMTWNNLGVAYSRLQLSGKAVASYQVAADKGESIAEGNLAHLLKDAGFFTEAKERAERALKLETPHENVIEALRAIQEARSSEDEEHTKLSNKGQARQRARRDIGRHCWKVGNLKRPTRNL